MPEPIERDDEWLIEQVAAALAGEVTDYQVAKFYGLEDGEPVEALHRAAYAKKKARAAVRAILEGIRLGLTEVEGVTIAGFARFHYTHTELNQAAGKPTGTLCAAGVTLGPLKPNWLTEKREELRETVGNYAGEMLGPEIAPADWAAFVGYIEGVYYQSPSLGGNNEDSPPGWFVVKKTVSVDYRFAVGADAWSAWAKLDSVRGVLVWGYVEYRGVNQSALIISGVPPARSDIFGIGNGVGNYYLFADKWAEFAALKISVAQAWANPLAAGFPASEMLKCFPRVTAWARRMPPDGSLRSEPVQWLTFWEFMDRWERWRDADIAAGRVWPDWPADREVSAFRVRCQFAPEFVAAVGEQGAI